VLLSELEAEANQAGFEVVSWRVLRDSSVPIKTARENGVDILFEINDMGFKTPTAWVKRRTETSFFDEEEREPLVVPDPHSIALRCDEFFGALQEPIAVAFNVKTVRVEDGRVLWYYQVKRAEGWDKDTEVRSDRFHRPPIIPNPPFKVKPGKLVAGVLMTTLGGAGAIPLLIFDETRNYGVLALGVAGLGIYLTATARTRAEVTYPAVDAILCNKDYRVGLPAEQVVDEPEAGSKAVIESVALRGAAVEFDKRRELLIQVAREFMAEVAEINRGGARRPSATKPAPPKPPKPVDPTPPTPTKPAPPTPPTGPTIPETD
jgi:hypothetical protein